MGVCKGRVVGNVIGILLILTGFAGAEDAHDLGPIVVTPYRYQQVLDKSASSLTIISSTDLKRSNAKTVADVLRTVPGVNVRDYYGHGNKVAVDIAGFGEQAGLNVLVLVDGRRVNDVDLSGVDWSQVPLDQIDHIEVLRGGAAGVLYGDAASSGVINLITRRGSGKPQLNVQTEYGSYAYNAQKLSVKGGAKKLSYWLSSGRTSTQGYRENSYSDALDLSSRLSYDFTEDVSFDLDAGSHRFSYGLPGALFQNHINQYGRRFARFGEDYAKGEDQYISVSMDAATDEAGAFSLGTHYRQKDMDSFFFSSGNPMLKSKIETIGLTPKHTFKTTLGDHDNITVTGVDLYRSSYRSRQLHRTNDSVLLNYSNVNKTSAAGYIQNELSLTDPLTLINGYRYEAVEYTFGYHDNDTTSFGHPFPDQDKKIRPQMRAVNSGLVYRYQDESSVFVNAGQSFRLPAVDEFAFQDENFQQQLDTNLKPQTAMTYQTGVRHKFSEEAKADLSLFWMDVHDELYLNFTGGPWGMGKNENYNETVHRGFNTSGELKLTKWLTTFGNYSFTDAYFGKGEYNKNEIPLVARHTAALGLRTALSKTLTWSVVNAYTGPRYAMNDQANAQGKVNGFTVVDTNLSWKVADLTTTVGVNNVFNRKYSEIVGFAFNSSTFANERFYYPSPERNFNLKVDYKF